MKRIADWFDERIGYRGLVRGMLYEHIPGGARWRYVWGSTLVFCFITQIVTGIFLWMSYSPSSQTAWESVYYIQHEMSGGWLLRGIHHFTAQAMIVLLVLHVMQVIIDGAYKAPREVNFWIGLVLLQITLGLSLTGYLLPWDQKGYWATKVATSLTEAVPLVGPAMQKIIIGGHDYGHHTLTRFFALHAGVLPAALVGFLVIHIYAFRRHGIKAKLQEHHGWTVPSRLGSVALLLGSLALCYLLFRKPGSSGAFEGLWPGVIIGGGIILLFWLVMQLTPPKRKDAHFWPEQVLKDAVACLAVLGAVIFLTIYLGAPLSAPADPTEQFSAARPEWYFLFLFQLLKYFPGEQEIIGAIVLPGVVMLVLVLMPFIGKSRPGHIFNVAFIFVLLGGAGYLTIEALLQDAGKPEYTHAVARAEIDARRAIELAQGPAGIPTSGALTLVRDDPKTMGPRLFAASCAGCHRYDGHDGLGRSVVAKPTAADLHGYAGGPWLTTLLTPQGFRSDGHFGGTKFANGRMAKHVDKMAKLDDDGKKALATVVANLTKLADADLPMKETPADKKRFDEHRDLIEATSTLLEDKPLSCLNCHDYYGAGTNEAPDLSSYRSLTWIRAVITDPKHVAYEDSADSETKKYPMPAFGVTGQLDEKSIDLLARWLRGQWYEAK